MLKFAGNTARLYARRANRGTFGSTTRASAFLSKGQQWAGTRMTNLPGTGLARRLGAPLRPYGTQKTSQSLASSKAGITNTLSLAVASTAGAGAIALAFHGYTTAEADGDLDDRLAWRMRYTYIYLVGSLGLTAVTARALFLSGAARRIIDMNFWTVLGLSAAGTFSAYFATYSIPYEVFPFPGPNHTTR